MAEATPESRKTRLVSLDALRGFDMFWIMGGSGLVLALAKVLGLSGSGFEGLARQMTHVDWDGFRFYDLIFPLFVFMSGVTVPYSVLARKAKGVSPGRLQLRIVKRSLILIAIGLSFSVFRFQPEAIRLYTVLWLIGMSYLIGASITLHVENWKTRLIVFFTVLLLYHLAIFYLPYPGKGDGITPDNNLAAWLDRSLIQTNLYRTVYDPEGTIRVITGGMLCLLGGLAGIRIKSYRTAKPRCGLELFVAGLGCLLIAWVWGFFFPIIKDLWSPSFILWSAGWSLLLLALFYMALDVWRLKWLGWFFIPIGMNSITIYAAQRFIPFGEIRNLFFKGFSNTLSHVPLQGLTLAFGLVFIQWLFLYWLYRKKIFFKV